MRQTFSDRRHVYSVAILFTLCQLLLLLLTTTSSRTLAFAPALLQQRYSSNTNNRIRLAAANILSSQQVNQRLQAQLEKLREKDKKCPKLSPSDLKIVYEDDDIIVVDKPSGVLTVATAPGVNSLVETVYEYCCCNNNNNNSQSTLVRMDQMVVHRLGMDTSGLLVMAKNIQAVRVLHSLFRTRNIVRQYEALVCGHISNDNNNNDNNEGLIALPLMRDYEHPPYMRVSTIEHQQALVDLDPAIVGKKLLEAPKASLTHYQVISREYLNNTDLPVTRLTLTSISGRTHQLNVHCAAMGHPIVRDVVYGYQGDAAAFGGLDNTNAVLSTELLEAINNCDAVQNMCVHAKYLEFAHPRTTKRIMQFTSEAPF